MLHFHQSLKPLLILHYSTSKVYKISGRGNIESASANNTSGLRPVIVLNSKVMYKDGKGTLESPYTLR